MGSPYVGEIRMFGGNFAPAGWNFCDGSQLSIVDNETLFNLIGTTYGGDGVNTFAVPDLRGRAPMHMGQGPGISQNYQIGEVLGVETVTVTTNQMPNHTHVMVASDDVPAGLNPSGNVTGQAATRLYRAGSPSLQLNSGAVSPSGGNQPHENMQPYLVINFIISLFGIYPSPS